MKDITRALGELLVIVFIPAVIGISFGRWQHSLAAGIFAAGIALRMRR